MYKIIRKFYNYLYSLIHSLPPSIVPMTLPSSLGLGSWNKAIYIREMSDVNRSVLHGC